MSTIIRFISDPHFGHESAARSRGFSSVDEMNSCIIDGWNSVVKSKRDITYILGDITMEKTKYYPLLNELNGIKKVVLGNHDKPQHVPELMKYVSHVYGVQVIKKHNLKLILTHCPIHPSEFEMSRFDYNLHGHTHDKEIYDTRYMNVCVDVQDYVPKTISELVANNLPHFVKLETETLTTIFSLDRQDFSDYTKNYYSVSGGVKLGINIVDGVIYSVSDLPELHNKVLKSVGDMSRCV